MFLANFTISDISIIIVIVHQPCCLNLLHIPLATCLAIVIYNQQDVEYWDQATGFTAFGSGPMSG